ncbi:ester cyclase [Microbispora sp. H11081]|uniref:ester cyclase n=1 Tax=Microbispora sp. H11081 TaxID=2729107 RepID=UPI001473EB85|nr:ester cyclase [Microbispora sp. H11081]
MSTAYDVRDELFRVFNDHDLSQLGLYYSASAIWVGPEGMAEGLEQIVTVYEQQLLAFPDARLTPWYKATCSDPAVTEWMLTGTHLGPFLLPCGRYLEGSRRRIAVRGCCVVRVEDGKVITHQVYYDQMELCSQLGLPRVAAMAD